MSFWHRLNPTVRGLVVVALVAVVIVVLRLQATLVALGLLVSIAFFLAIAFFVYLVWREHRGDIEAWPARARVVFYGAALLIVLDLARWWLNRNLSGLDALTFVAVLPICAFAMWRVWRDQHTYG